MIRFNALHNLRCYTVVFDHLSICFRACSHRSVSCAPVRGLETRLETAESPRPSVRASAWASESELPTVTMEALFGLPGAAMAQQQSQSSTKKNVAKDAARSITRDQRGLDRGALPGTPMPPAHTSHVAARRDQGALPGHTHAPGTHSAGHPRSSLACHRDPAPETRGGSPVRSHQGHGQETRRRGSSTAPGQAAHQPPRATSENV